MRQNPHVRICEGPGSVNSPVYSTVFREDVEALEIYDAAHSETEERFITIGPIRRGLVLVVWTDRDEEIVRIISARWASPNETQRYRDEVGRKHE